MFDTPPVLVSEPVGRVSVQPIVVDSPHSGMTWPPDFQPSASRHAIHTTWDAFVDELWGDAPLAGATLISASFPRAYIDVNRAVDDIDAALLAEPWPVPLTPTAYTARGMGLIRRNALPDEPMYDRKLSLAEVQHRIANYYRPYRETVQARLDALHARFGAVWHVNCHSMKSRGNAMNVDNGAVRPNVVLGDRRGTTADSALTAWAAEWFDARGFSVSVNEPYQGGDLVRSTGAPAQHRHSIQIELNRALYMDEAAFARGPRFDEIRTLCGDFVAALATRAGAIPGAGR